MPDWDLFHIAAKTPLWRAASELCQPYPHGALLLTGIASRIGVSNDRAKVSIPSHYQVLSQRIFKSYLALVLAFSTYLFDDFRTIVALRIRAGPAPEADYC